MQCSSMNINPKQIEGSRPPPTKRPSTSALSILVVMILVIVGAFIASGNLAPVDPNGAGGPPTVEPYYNSSDYPAQHIVTPKTQPLNGQQKLQLQTFQVDNCGDNAAILFVIDTSGSMSYVGKLDKTKSAMKYITSKLGGKAVIGIDTFSKDVIPEVFLSYYKDVKQPVAKVIQDLSAGGWTRTRDVMEMARDQLSKAIDENEFPGYQYNLILMTDGVPEIPDASRHCEWSVPDPNLAGGIRCFAKEEDPRYPSDVTNEIKALGVDVYTINVYNPNYKSDKLMKQHLDDLLIEMASTPTDTHYYVFNAVTSTTSLNDILKNINNNICYDKFNGAIQTK